MTEAARRRAGGGWGARGHRATALLPVALLLLVAGCSTPKSPDAPAPAGVGAAYERFNFSAVPGQPPAAPAPGPYRLGVGDVLSVSVYGEVGSQREVAVDPNGNITCLLIGTLPAAGRSIDELRADMQKLLSAKLRRGVINVFPVRFESQTYTILGELNSPGAYLLQGDTTVLDAIARARGIRTGSFRNSTAEMADFRHATFMRQGQLLPLDFEALLLRGDAAQNLPLRNGDTITIPSSLTRSVYVLGEVKTPRTVGFLSSVSLLQAIAESRGLTDLSDGRIVVVRGSLAKPEARVVNYYQIIKGKETDVRLAPGDILYVPPPRFALLRDIVEAAITAYATAASSETARQWYQQNTGKTSTTTTPVIITPVTPAPPP